jgi:RNA polymerase sigma-70 factor, ECF subfamily
MTIMLATETEVIRQDLHNYITRITGNSVSADDIVQDAFLRVMNKFDDDPDIDQFRAYLFRTAHNLVIDSHRSSKHHSKYQTIDNDFISVNPDSNSNDDPLIGMVRDEANKCVSNLAKKLGWRDLQALELVVYGGLDLRHASAVLGISHEAMKVRLHRARKRMKTLLDNDCIIGKDEDSNLSCEQK